MNHLQKNDEKILLHANEQQVLDVLSLKMVFPFNIKNINFLFFRKLDDHEHDLTKEEEKLLSTIYDNPTEYKYFRKNNNFWTTENNLQNVVNLVATNVVNSTSKNFPIFEPLNTFCDSFVYPIFQNKAAFNADNVANFNYGIKVSKESDLYSIIKQFDIVFSVNKISQRISGGFNLEYNLDPSLSFNDSVDLIYLLTLFKENINNQLFPLSMDNILEIMQDLQDALHHSTHNHNRKQKEYKELVTFNSVVNFKEISFKGLHKLWDDLIEEKYISQHHHSFSDDTLKYLKDDLFYGLMLMMCIMLYMVFEFNNFFTSQDKFAIVSKKYVNNHEVVGKEEDGLRQNFVNLLEMVHHTYYHNEPIFRSLNLKKNSNKTLIKKDPVSLKDVSVNYSLTSPSLIYSLKPTLFKNMVHLDEMLNNRSYLTILLMILFPKYFLLNLADNTMFPNLTTVHKYIGMLNEMDLQTYKEKIKETLCENTYYYYSFVQNDNIILIENNSYDPKCSETMREISYFYLLGLCFVQSRLAEFKNIQKIGNFIQFTTSIKWKNIPYHKVMRDLNDIYFDANSVNIFATKKLSPILEKLDKDYELRQKIRNEQDEIRLNDELFKRGIERSNFFIAFIVAILVGFIEFFGQVYSETTDTVVVGNGWPGIDATFPWIPMTLSWTSTSEFALLCILIYAFYRMVYMRTRLKRIDEHRLQMF